MKAFMTQEEKIKNKQLLDLWTSKAQIKGFLLEKQRIMTQQVKRNQVNELYDEFKKSSKDIISSVQLNQKQMQAMLGIQESISEFIAIFFKKLTREEHQQQIQATVDRVKAIMSDQLKTFSGKSTDLQKYQTATMLFDLIFNTPIKSFSQRIQDRITSKLDE